jgi:DnaK suppressor protein
MPKRIRRKKLREMLQGKKLKLLSDLHQEVFERLGNEYHEEFERAMDAGDEALVDLLQSIDIKLADIRRAELIQINEAERKLSEGTYGICKECGRDIGEERLVALPYAVRCIECEDHFERADSH